MGGSGILIGYRDRWVLLDYGMYLNSEKKLHSSKAITPPMGIHVSDLDAVVATHSHLDHSGGIPQLYTHFNPNYIATPLTHEVNQILIRDMMKLSGGGLPFETREIEKMNDAFTPVYFGSKIRILPDYSLTFFDSGHIPGGVSVLVEAGKKRIFYTSDFNTAKTRLLGGAKLSLPPLDAVITESTYATLDHSPRLEIEDALINFIEERISAGGFVIIPAFAVARSQEILSILEKHDIPYPRYLDGLGREISKLYLQYQPYFQSFSLLQRAIRNTHLIHSHRQRSQIIKKSGIVVTTAGMMKGGPVMEYMRLLYDEPATGIALVGYQLPGTPGRSLLENQRFPIGDQECFVKSKTQYFDFSSHIGATPLNNFLTQLTPRKDNIEIFCVHGESDSVSTLAEQLNEKPTITATAPQEGETIHL